MPTHDPLTSVRRTTPQHEPTPGRSDEVKNHHGAYVHAVDPWGRLNRFLILGTDSGTFYASARELTIENYDVVLQCLAEDPVRTIEMIRDISVAGRAPKPNPAIFALAVAAADERAHVRRDALAAMPQVCRTGTHLFLFVKYVRQFRGWGRALKRAVADWYLTKTPKQVAYQVTKYANREGYTHRDLLRLAKPTGERSADMDAVLSTVVGKPTPEIAAPGTGLEYMRVFAEAKNCTDVDRAIQLVESFNLPWEALPTQMLREPKVWEALVPRVGLTALMRNLGRLSNIGLLDPMGGSWATIVADRFDEESVRKARLHPLVILNAQATYMRGQGDRGSLTWNPSMRVAEALDAAFYASWGNVEPTGKRTLIALDVSGSMSTSIAGMALQARQVAAAMAQLFIETEDQAMVLGFSHELVQMNWFRRGAKLDQLVEQTGRLNFGATDCSLPMTEAQRQGLLVEHFIVITDSETGSVGRGGYSLGFGWRRSGARGARPKPADALRSYRQAAGVDAKMTVVATTSSGFTIADPKDPGMLDVVGFDTATPNVISEFARGG